jgi:hypothetical protein
VSKVKDIQIALEPIYTPRLRSFGMNWACTSQKPFALRPSSFTSTIEGMKSKTFSQQKQLASYQVYHEDPSSPGVFGISSSPNDGQAKLMAAYMMQEHMKTSPGARPRWHDVTGGFTSEFLEKEPINCTMLVLNNVGPDNVPIKREKLRDILERYSDIPVVVVVNGCDPFTYFTRDLRKALSGILYLTASIARKIHDV